MTVSGHKNQGSLTSYCYDTSGIYFLTKFEDTKGAIKKNHKSKDRKDNTMAKIKRDNKTNDGL